MSSLLNCLLHKEKNLPVWFMRQAGRYLPEYQEIRKNNKDFIKFCLNINDAAKVSIQPINRFDLDAIIVFSDILLILNATGQKVEFKEDIGPVLNKYNINKFYNLKDKELTNNLINVYKIIKKIKKKKKIIKERKGNIKVTVDRISLECYDKICEYYNERETLGKIQKLDRCEGGFCVEIKKEERESEFENDRIRQLRWNKKELVSGMYKGLLYEEESLLYESMCVILGEMNVSQ